MERRALSMNFFSGVCIELLSRTKSPDFGRYQALKPRAYPSGISQSGGNANDWIVQ